jgi:hypothetical protein
MRFRAVLVAVVVFGSLILPPVSASAFTFGSYCIKLSSPGIKWLAPKVGGSEVFKFSYINSCQKIIPSLQVDFSEDVSGGNFSQWNSLSEIFAVENVIPGEQGNIQITMRYDQYISARDKIYLRIVESESILSSSGTNTTNNVSLQSITFSTARTLSNTSSTSTTSNNILAKGNYTETANDDKAPISSSDVVGNIRRINVLHKSNGTLELTIDYWKVPNSNFTTRIRWCAPDAFDDYDGMGICDSTNPNWLNYLMFFSPSKSSKGYQAGVRNSFKGTSRKGSSPNQIIYTISGSVLKSGSVGLVEVLMLYSSSIFTERTTTCTGGYTITCNTRSSNIFERDEADVKLE